MSIENETIEYNDRNLKKLIKAFDNIPYVKVGILGKTKSRSEGDIDNVKLGVIHEFGTDKIPMRSFLRIPIAENLDQYLKSAGAFKKNVIKKIISEESLEDFVKKIGKVAEKIVLDAFNTGGFGKWKPSNMKYKKVKQTLVETTQLRDSITSEIEK
jgi:hypothetical protein